MNAYEKKVNEEEYGIYVPQSVVEQGKSGKTVEGLTLFEQIQQEGKRKSKKVLQNYQESSSHDEMKQDDRHAKIMKSVGKISIKKEKKVYIKGNRYDSDFEEDEFKPDRDLSTESVSEDLESEKSTQYGSDNDKIYDNQIVRDDSDVSKLPQSGKKRKSSENKMIVPKTSKSNIIVPKTNKSTTYRIDPLQMSSLLGSDIIKRTSKNYQILMEKIIKAQIPFFCDPGKAVSVPNRIKFLRRRFMEDSNIPTFQGNIVSDLEYQIRSDLCQPLCIAWLDIQNAIFQENVVTETHRVISRYGFLVLGCSGGYLQFWVHVSRSRSKIDNSDDPEIHRARKYSQEMLNGQQEAQSNKEQMDQNQGSFQMVGVFVASNVNVASIRWKAHRVDSLPHYNSEDPRLNYRNWIQILVTGDAEGQGTVWNTRGLMSHVIEQDTNILRNNSAQPSQISIIDSDQVQQICNISLQNSCPIISLDLQLSTCYHQQKINTLTKLRDDKLKTNGAVTPIKENGTPPVLGKNMQIIQDLQDKFITTHTFVELRVGVVKTGGQFIFYDSITAFSTASHQNQSVDLENNEPYNIIKQSQIASYISQNDVSTLTSVCICPYDEVFTLGSISSELRSYRYDPLYQGSVDKIVREYLWNNTVVDSGRMGQEDKRAMLRGGTPQLEKLNVQEVSSPIPMGQMSNQESKKPIFALEQSSNGIYMIILRCNYAEGSMPHLHMTRSQISDQAKAFEGSIRMLNVAGLMLSPSDVRVAIQRYLQNLEYTSLIDSIKLGLTQTESNLKAIQDYIKPYNKLQAPEVVDQQKQSEIKIDIKMVWDIIDYICMGTYVEASKKILFDQEDIEMVAKIETDFWSVADLELREQFQRLDIDEEFPEFHSSARSQIFLLAEYILNTLAGKKEGTIISKSKSQTKSQPQKNHDQSYLQREFGSEMSRRLKQCLLSQQQLAGLRSTFSVLIQPQEILQYYQQSLEKYLPEIKLDQGDGTQISEINCLEFDYQYANKRLIEILDQNKKDFQMKNIQQTDLDILKDMLLEDT